MNTYQSFSYRLLSEMDPTFLSSLHLSYENSDKVNLEYANTGINGSMMKKIIKILKMNLS